MLPVYLASPYNATYCCQIKLLELTMLYIPKQYNFLSILSVCFKCYNFVYMEDKQCFCLYFRITKDFKKCLFYSMYSLCYPVNFYKMYNFYYFLSTVKPQHDRNTAEMEHDQNFSSSSAVECDESQDCFRHLVEYLSK